MALTSPPAQKDFDPSPSIKTILTLLFEFQSFKMGYIWLIMLRLRAFKALGRLSLMMPFPLTRSRLTSLSEEVLIILAATILSVG